MAFAEQLIHRIDSPDLPVLQELQQQAIDEIEPIVADSNVPDVTEGVIRRLSYTYYYDWETDDPEYMWLVQDPGNLHGRHLSELRFGNPLADGCAPRDQVSVYRQFGKSWRTGRNADFSEKVLTTLDDLGLIDIDGSWEAYLEQERFYQDIYLGDVVKYRTDGFGKREEEVSYEEFLAEEIRQLNPSLIFSFGGNAWNTIQREMNTAPARRTNADSGKMMDIHGVLHQVESPIDTYVLPLSHMSGQVWWRFPPDEYVEGVKTGIRLWQEIR